MVSWVMFLFAWLSTPSPTTSTTVWSFFRYFEIKVCTHFGIVAENSNFCASGGVLDKMSSTSSEKPIESISSASSSTTKRTHFKSIVPLLMWSNSLPGVATTPSKPARSSSHCGPKAVPPYRQVAVRLWAAPMKFNSLKICFANSRVGAKARKSGFLLGLPLLNPSATIRSIAGRTKAKVFPQPVFARPTVSLPLNAGPKARCCTSNKVVMPRSLSAFFVGFVKPSTSDKGFAPMCASLSPLFLLVAAAAFCFFGAGSAAAPSSSSSGPLDNFRFFAFGASASA
mmetsp:Transcript_94536/g.273288  ORF Transcript_94536/g.273288 Transcript_94536/m.273288 type:complete len:284 (+) Transcript_94536:1075-1926(+)